MTRIGRAVVAGGTGLVGSRLVRALAEAGTKVTILTRTPGACALPAEARGWDELGEALEGADALFNLAGEGIADHRWTPARKAALRASRVESTSRLVEAVGRARARPKVLVNASAVGYYGPRDGTPLDEGTASGTGFLADLCRAWEEAAEGVARHGVRLVKARLGVVLAPEGGALPKMALPVKLFQGAPLGNGQQGLSWIHIDDLVALLLEAASNDAYEGAVNACAPWPVNNDGFTRHLARALHRPVLPVPAWITRSAVGLLFGEMAEEMLLRGAFVYPKKAQALGFQFRFPSLEGALADLYQANSAAR